MGDVIFYSFGRRVEISREEWLAGAWRCERLAESQSSKIADTLRRCAAHYRMRAEGGGRF